MVKNLFLSSVSLHTKWKFESASHARGNTGAGVSQYKGQFLIEQEHVLSMCQTCDVYSAEDKGGLRRMDGQRSADCGLEQVAIRRAGWQNSTDSRILWAKMKDIVSLERRLKVSCSRRVFVPKGAGYSDLRA